MGEIYWMFHIHLHADKYSIVLGRLMKWHNKKVLVDYYWRRDKL